MQPRAMSQLSFDLGRTSMPKPSVLTAIAFSVIPLGATSASSGVLDRYTGSVIPYSSGGPCLPPGVCEPNRLLTTCQTPGYECKYYAE
jgi:hypothetical protein